MLQGEAQRDILPCNRFGLTMDCRADIGIYIMFLQVFQPDVPESLQAGIVQPTILPLYRYTLRHSYWLRNQLL